VYDAAEHLGITVDAIRKRIQRGTIAHERDEEGRVWVLLDESSKVHDTDQDTYRTVGPAEFIEEMRERIHDLREQLAAERRANEENRRIIAALTQRIPEIEAPREPSGATEPREAPSEATPQPGRVEPQPAVQSTQAQESPEMAMPEAGGGPLPRDQQRASERPWWRRLFGP
jgi:hypothetical protein